MDGWETAKNPLGVDPGTSSHVVDPFTVLYIFASESTFSVSVPTIVPNLKGSRGKGGIPLEVIGVMVTGWKDPGTALFLGDKNQRYSSTPGTASCA
jgi:hypothetical protein